MNKITREIENFDNLNIAVIGDLCLDMYYFLTDYKSEISVETGLRTQSVSEFANEAGGAGNVAINLKTLGAERVDAYGVIGNDSFGLTLKSRLQESGINCNFIQTQNTEWSTHVYHKFYKNGKEGPRCDIGNFNEVNKGTIDALLKDLESNIPSYQVVIINEQIAHGYHTEAFQNGLQRLIKKHKDDCFWITDCRHLNNRYNQTIRKLNIHEARGLYTEINQNKTTVPDNTALITWLFKYWEKPVVITLGEDGAIAVNQEGRIERINGINIIGRTDTVGAGDAFLSGFALTMASGGSLGEALNIGNFSAAVSVKKVFQTGHPTMREVIEMSESADYRYNSEIAGDRRKAVFLNNSHIELLNLNRTAFPKVAIFDHDGTISTLRQGWEPIMKEVCINSILGNSPKLPDSDEMNKINNAASEMIEKTTGIQTIIQMHHLRDMVESFGLVPKNDILSPKAYKDIYNKLLLEMVAERVTLFKKGLLDLNDVTMKGAVPFLELLKERGVLIYLASGTDEEDVKNEASILGYDNFFNGGIFGSTGNTKSDPKKLVIETIIKGLPDDIRPEECYVFGDGPVEMREAAKRGFTRIGLVSDEKQRFGINNEKRSRLILGGAQALIPDFSWIQVLAEYLGWEKN